MNRNSGHSQAQSRGFGGGCTKNSFHTLLRLDSVGEVTSGKQPINLNQPREGTQNKQSNHINSTMAILQPNSLLGSWNSGCGASKSLTCSHQSKPFTVLTSMFLGNNNNPGQLYHYTSADIANRNTEFCSMDYPCRVISKQSRSTFDNLCGNHIQQTMVYPQKYIPPPLRVGHDHNKPSTPYNSRLLANSRKADSWQPKLLAHCMSAQSNKCVITDRKCSNDNKEINLPADFVNGISKNENRVPNEDVGEHQNDCVPTNNIHSVHVSKETSPSSTDWFEYICQSKYVPIVISEDKLQGENSSTAVESDNSPSEHPEKQTGIHSWFSNEFDEKVEKTVNLHLPSHDSGNVGDECYISQNVLPCTSNSSTKREQDCITEFQPAVLFCRSVGKKARPSKKKRRQQLSRQKAPLVPADSSGAVKDSQGSMKVDKTVCINIHSFQFTCDSDGSDWSDDEGDFDEDFSSLEEDGELGLRCNDLFNSLSNLSVSCSILKACDNENAAVSSRLQAINNFWQEQNESQPTIQKRSNKQVRFAADHDLTSVHTIIAWRHAYASARKGPWEEYARDRARFARKIEECAAVLNPILSSMHRSNVFTQRFMANDN